MSVTDKHVSDRMLLMRVDYSHKRIAQILLDKGAEVNVMLTTWFVSITLLVMALLTGCKCGPS